MEDLKREFEPRPDPTMPQYKEANPSRAAEQASRDGAGEIQLENMKMTYAQHAARGQQTNNEQTAVHGPHEERDGAEMAILGFARVEKPPKHPQEVAIIEQLLPQRNPSLPPPVIPESDPEDGFTLVSPPEAYDDLAILKPKTQAAAGQELRLYRQVDLLQQRVESMKTRAEIAEEKAELMEHRNAELKKRVECAVSEDETLKEAAALVEEVEKLEDENKTLKEQLRDAQSHIFSLQPYREELTPEKVGRVRPPSSPVS
jgi:hypothetical protein